MIFVPMVSTSGKYVLGSHTLSCQCVWDAFENTHIQIFDGFATDFTLVEPIRTMGNRELNRRLQYVE